MELYDAFSAGVETGGLINTTQIRALICYLIRNLDYPLSGEQIREVLQEQEIANYFDVSESLTELLRSGIITAEYNETEEELYLTKTGEEAVRELTHEIPKTIREKALSAALEMAAKARNAKQNDILIEPSGSGYNVTFFVGDHDDLLMRLTVYAADMQQANRMKNNFIKDPVQIYSQILASLIV